MGSAEAPGPNVGEKPNTMGSAEVRGPNVSGNPNTIGAAVMWMGLMLRSP
ncbi:hypothetical protein [Paenibacillus sp. FSL M7-0896]